MKTRRKGTIVVTIALIMALAVSWAAAYFTHTLQVGRFRFTAGAVEIAIEPGMIVVLEDVKPCYTGYVVFNVSNVGSNPVDLYKHVYDITCYENGVAPAEKQWYDKNLGGEPKNDIHRWILYDLWVEVYVPVDGGFKLLWWQGIYDETVTIAQIESRWIYLGMLPVGAHMKVIQSYHLKAETQDWAQTDIMDFDIEVKAEQLTGVRTLENKDGTDQKWLIQHDDVAGTLEYNVIGKGNTFKYSFTGKAPMPNTEYSLIYYLDPWGSTPQLVVLGTATTDVNGDVTITGTADTGTLPQDIDANHPYGAKIWLVLTGDIDGETMTAWNPDSYLFETGLIIHREQ